MAGCDGPPDGRPQPHDPKSRTQVAAVKLVQLGWKMEWRDLETVAVLAMPRAAAEGVDSAPNRVAEDTTAETKMDSRSGARVSRAVAAV